MIVLKNFFSSKNSKEPYLILGESRFGSPLKSFIRRNIFSLDDRVRKDAKPLRFRVAGACLTVFMPLYLWWVMEYLYFGSVKGVMSFLRDGSNNAAAFSVSTLYLWFCVLWLLVKNGVVASLIMMTGCYALSVASYFKHALTGDFVYPWDLINQTGNITELAGFVKIGFPFEYVICLLGGILIIGLLFFLRPRIRLRFIPRVLIAALLVFIALWGVRTPEKIDETLGRFKMGVLSTANQEVNHSTNGFTGAFAVNLYAMKTTRPDDYSEEKISELMSGYEGTGNEDFSYPDIVVILLESFWNPKLLPNTVFSENPIANFEEIANRKNSASGYMYQTAFGGGTVRTEFEVLTGLSADYLPVGAVPWQYVKDEIPTYASVFREMGYETVFLHTFSSAFYLRNKTYPRLGFDDIYFAEDLEKIESVKQNKRGNYVSDDSFAEYVKYMLNRKGGKPKFIFGISMENHQPYEGKYAQTVIDIANPNMSDEGIYVTRNYTTGVYYEDNALKSIVDYIDSRKKETLLIYFGDHLPNLGTNKLAYVESGFIGKTEMSDSDWDKLMKTPFLVYGNFDLESGETLKLGKENKISSFSLMNGALELANSPKTPMMEFLTDYGKVLPYYNNRLKIKTDGKQTEFVNAHRLLTYDILHGDKYSLK